MSGANGPVAHVVRENAGGAGVERARARASRRVAGGAQRAHGCHELDGHVGGIDAVRAQRAATARRAASTASAVSVAPSRTIAAIGRGDSTRR
jgi:hypothetical protein